MGGDLSLGSLAAMAGLSPFHFHRIFREATGETARHYVERVRLERAAFRLMIHDDAALDIALDCGFRNHETFVRAFRRRYGRTPSEYRAAVSGWKLQTPGDDRKEGRDESEGFELSEVRVVEMKPIHLASIRHIGPYESVSDGLWNELTEWARQRGGGPPYLFLGIGHDSPATVEAAALRFDAAIRVQGPFASDGRVVHQILSGGPHALITHVGHYRTLSAAYAKLFPALFTMARYRVAGLPVVEIYKTARVNAALAVNTTDIHVPLERR